VIASQVAAAPESATASPVVRGYTPTDTLFAAWLAADTLVLYACYLGFALYPVAGPRYYFGVATGPEVQGYIARIVHAILESGSAWGTAFPSSHVATAWAAAFILWKDARRAALLLMPISLGVAFGTVYGQFHYGVDALSGAVAAVVLCALADPLRKALRRASRPFA
jgi:membrane-associated phospholipid phosphatase